MPLYDFECWDCGNIEEKLVHSDTHIVVCGKCGSPMDRKLSAPMIKLEGVSRDFPTAAAKWDRLHTKKEIAKRAKTEV